MSNQATTMQAPGAAAKGGKGGATRMKNPLRPPRFSKNTNGASQSQVDLSSFDLCHSILLLLGQSKSNTRWNNQSTLSNFTDGSYVSNYLRSFSTRLFSTSMSSANVSRSMFFFSRSVLGYVRCLSTVTK